MPHSLRQFYARRPYRIALSRQTSSQQGYKNHGRNAHDRGKRSLDAHSQEEISGAATAAMRDTTNAVAVTSAATNRAATATAVVTTTGVTITAKSLWPLACSQWIMPLPIVRPQQTRPWKRTCPRQKSRGPYGAPPQRAWPQRALPQHALP